MPKTSLGPLDGLVKGIISNIEKRGGITEEELFEGWAAVVGKKAARHSKPRTFKKSEVVVSVDGSAWLYELTLKKKEILGKLAGRFKGAKIKNIRFRIGEVK